MLAIPEKKVEPSASIADGLGVVIAQAYGDFAAEASIVDAVALKKAREQATRARVTSADASPAAAEEPLLLYCAMLGRVDAVLGVELREQKALDLCWKLCWEDPPPEAGGKASSAKKAAGAVAAAIAASPPQHDLIVERAAAYVNLAACWSARGALSALDDTDAIKTAAKHFQLAAGALTACTQLQLESVLEACPADLGEGVMSAAKTLMLAQAQACFCEKASLDRLGASLQAKLCLGASQLYAKAAEAMEAVKGTCSKGLHAWGVAVAQARGKQYEASARWHAAEEAAAEEKHGVRQTQLALALAAAQAAQQILLQAAGGSGSGGGGGSGDAEGASPSLEAATAALASFITKASEAFRVVKRDNEGVYHEAAVDPSRLEPIDGKVLAKASSVAPLVEELSALPLPHRIRHPDDVSACGGAVDAPLADYFGRLGTEFRMVPLTERVASAGDGGGAAARGGAGREGARREARSWRERQQPAQRPARAFKKADGASAKVRASSAASGKDKGGGGGQRRRRILLAPQGEIEGGGGSGGNEDEDEELQAAWRPPQGVAAVTKAPPST